MIVNIDNLLPLSSQYILILFHKYMKLRFKKGVVLANQLNITTASASRIMTSISVPSVEQILKICDFFRYYYL